MKNAVRPISRAEILDIEKRAEESFEERLDKFIGEVNEEIESHLLDKAVRIPLPNAKKIIEETSEYYRVRIHRCNRYFTVRWDLKYGEEDDEDEDDDYDEDEE